MHVAFTIYLMKMYSYSLRIIFIYNSEIIHMASLLSSTSLDVIAYPFMVIHNKMMSVRRR